jgi:hypothetical protein
MSSNQSAAAQTAREPIAELPLEEAIHSSALEALLAAASNPALSEDLALALLKRNDVPSQVLDRLSKNAGAMKHRRVKLALVEHPKTPRHVSLPMVRHLFTFDLMQVALVPAGAADIKAAADQALINRLETVSIGEKLSLAKRASSTVAGELLLDAEPRVAAAALENPRLTEALLVKAVLHKDATAALIEAVCRHLKWSLRREIRMALLRTEWVPRERALEFGRSLPARVLREILHVSRLPENVKECLLSWCGGGPCPAGTGTGQAPSPHGPSEPA